MTDHSIVKGLLSHSCRLSESSSHQERATLQHPETFAANFFQIDIVQHIPACIWIGCRFGCNSSHTMLFLFLPDSVLASLKNHLHVCGLQTSDPGVAVGCTVQEPFLCTPAKMGTPSWFWEPLTADPLRQLRRIECPS